MIIYYKDKSGFEYWFDGTLISLEQFIELINTGQYIMKYLHRLGGPALRLGNIHKQYFLHGIEFLKFDFKTARRYLKENGIEKFRIKYQ